MSSLFRKGSKRKRPTSSSEENNDKSISASIKTPATDSCNIATNHGGVVVPPPPPPPPPQKSSNSLTTTFSDLGLCPPLVSTCRKLGFVRPTAVQSAIIPQILNTTSGQNQNHHLLTLSATGSGKTAAFALPLLHILSSDPYGIFALILTPTRELAKQIQQQILALGSGSGWKITCALIIGGEDVTRQNLELSKQPNFVVATPGRCAELCRGDSGGGLYKPNFRKVKFVVLDEADRLLCAGSGFERDVAECLLQSTTMMSGSGSGGKQQHQRVRRNICRTLLFSATMTRSLGSLEEMAGAGVGRLPLKKVVVREDGSWDDGERPVEKKKKKKEKQTAAADDDDDSAKPTAQDDGKSSNEEGGGKSSISSDSEEEEESDEGSTPNIPA
ncbi:hypothetical protein ACHAXR_002327, partial [Thalassiosira sp. AJA248-18]